jgi:alpha,alpha-trehalase
MKRCRRAFAARFCVVLLVWLSTHCAHAQVSPKPQGLDGIQRYIANGWDVLTRSMDKCDTVVDKKLKISVLYVPADVPTPPAATALQRKCPIRVERLPAAIKSLGSIDQNKIPQHGLLFLENSYVVPGGFFNEMYGWDSYFILLGLLRDNRLELARGMVENFFYEIEHYGAILNANRTYFLTRSQPPFLTSMILGVREAQKARGQEDRNWLAKAYGYAQRDYELWTREPHLAGTTGLSRYFDFGQGPAPEVSQSSDPYYSEVIQYLLRDREFGRIYLAEKYTESPGWPVTSVYGCKDGQPISAEGCKLVNAVGLTADFYKGDRSMRESGFDISFRFGPFSGATHHYAPVCLNSLLYKTEKDMEKLASMLGREEEAREWRKRAETRQQRVSDYMWDAGRGLFFDYAFEPQQRSTYEYATTFYPLWTGLATAEQARAVARNLALFEEPGGVVMSRRESRGQWDYPYGWAPVQLLAIEGLRRYGFADDANRLAYKFLSTVLENFQRDGTIREKYNVVTRSSETQVEIGYKANVVGFGWTNGVFLELLHNLPQDWVKRIGTQDCATACR